jgi:hypothetical protein
MIKRDAARTASETTACIIARRSGALIAGSALGSMFDVPNSMPALPMKISIGKVFMVTPLLLPSTSRSFPEGYQIFHVPGPIRDAAAIAGDMRSVRRILMKL